MAYAQNRALGQEGALWGKGLTLAFFNGPKGLALQVTTPHFLYPSSSIR